jgi:hypothetical protein
MGSLTEADIAVRDGKGRPAVATMDDRALLEEIVTKLRTLEDTVESFTSAARSNPAMRALLPRF